MEAGREHEASERRSFLKKGCAVFLSGLAGLVPAVSGVVVFLDPLRRPAGGTVDAQVTSLAALPADGVPRRFPVTATRQDAWNRAPRAPVGAVYLRRVPGRGVEALHANCPHAGCWVDFLAGENRFLCPCHNSRFEIDGRIADPQSPSPRGLDPLAVEIRGEGEVWIRFQNFRSGDAKRIPM
jgi:Rieske Fe-S protein